MKKKIGPWTQLSSKEKYKNKWMSIREDKVLRPDGTSGIYGVLDTKHPPVYIIAINKDKKILFIRTYRYPSKTWSWEIPAGGSDGEPFLKAAKRELQEETGYKAKQWKKLATLVSMAGLSSEWMHVYLAQNLSYIGNHAQQEEGITEVKAFSIRNIKDMISQGQLKDGQSLAALMAAFNYVGYIK